MKKSLDLLTNKAKLAKEILNKMYPNQPFTDEVRELKALKDIEWTLQFMQEAIHFNNVEIMNNFFAWLKRLFNGLNIEEKHVDLLYQKTKELIHEKFNDSEVDAFIEQIQISTYQDIAEISSDNPYKEDQETYLEALLETNQQKADAVVKELINKDVPIEDIYIYILQETMRKIGLLWLDGKISVGREHYSTSVTQYIMSTLYPTIFSTPKSDKQLISCTVGSELHELGIRMITDIFELHGWKTHYLGANLPTKEIVDFAKEHHPNVIALSVTMPYHVDLLEQTVKEIRNVAELNDVSIIVGGLPFITTPSLVEQVGADGFGKDAMEAIYVAEKLL